MSSSFGGTDFSSIPIPIMSSSLDMGTDFDGDVLVHPTEDESYPLDVVREESNNINRNIVVSTNTNRSNAFTSYARRAVMRQRQYNNRHMFNVNNPLTRNNSRFRNNYR
jgi:hypothetical protein